MNTVVSLPLQHSLIPPKAAGPVRLAIVGVNFGAGIARNLADQHPYVHVAGVCDMAADKAQALGAELGVPGYASLDEVLSNPEVEAVALFTPPFDRAALIRRVLESGRHVMTTKPFELDGHAASAVLEEARRRGLAVHLNSPTPVPSEDLSQIQRWVSEHRLGRAVAMRAETWANYREVSNGSWYDDPARCPAAPIFRLGIYFLNDFAHLLGEPSRVHVTQSRVFTGRPTSDNAQLTIEYSNGSLANIFASFCIGDGRPWSDAVTLNYENGTIRRWVERTGSQYMGGDHAVLELTAPGVGLLRAKTSPGGYAGWYDWKAFYHAVRGDCGSVLLDAEGILSGIRVLNAMTRSSQSGQPEWVQPAAVAVRAQGP